MYSEEVFRSLHTCRTSQKPTPPPIKDHRDSFPEAEVERPVSPAPV